MVADNTNLARPYDVTSSGMSNLNGSPTTRHADLTRLRTGKDSLTRLVPSSSWKRFAVWYWASIILLLIFPIATNGSPSDWYTKYPAYPPYCSTPAEMKKRVVPPLAEDAKLGATRLVHVTSVIRHGARTPLSTCWIGRSVGGMPWNCNLTTIVTTPTPNEMSQVEGLKSKNPDLYQLSVLEKRYDALQDPALGLSNTLNGTCQFGQLILQGYEQEVTNGIHLRNAYLYDGATYEHDERMRLINIATPLPFTDPSVRFRSDDDQRTVMSGQIVLQGMFGPELIKATKQTNGQPPIIPVHVADRDRDVLASNEAICPRLTELRDQFETSKEFRSFNLSSEAQHLRRFMKQKLGSTMDHEAIDCLMTTICTDRPLPAAIDDYGHKPNRTRHLHNGIDDGDEEGGQTKAEAPKMFQSIYDFYVKRNALYLGHNDAEYAKLAMGPMWAEIMDNIDHVVDPKAHSSSSHTAAKFALFSGHDATIMPLLATLGPRVWEASEWPPYASMVLIEIHEIIDGKTDRNVFKSSFAFRLIYNGKVITSRMDGCPLDSELCDAQVLLQRVKPFATRSRNCARKTKSIFISSIPNVSATVESGHWIMSFFVLLCGMALGSILTNVYVRQCQQRQPLGRVLDDTEGRVSLTQATDLQLYSDEPESLYGHDARGKTSEFEAAAIEATLA